MPILVAVAYVRLCNVGGNRQHTGPLVFHAFSLAIVPLSERSAAAQRARLKQARECAAKLAVCWPQGNACSQQATHEAELNRYPAPVLLWSRRNVISEICLDASSLQAARKTLEQTMRAATRHAPRTAQGGAIKYTHTPGYIDQRGSRVNRLAMT
jgi:hypothetical protein